MQNFTQKALMIVLTLFVLVGLFYGLSTPIKNTSASSSSLNPALPKPHDGPVPLCPTGSPDPTTGDCPGK